MENHGPFGILVNKGEIILRHHECSNSQPHFMLTWGPPGEVGINEPLAHFYAVQYGEQTLENAEAVVEKFNKRIASPVIQNSKEYQAYCSDVRAEVKK